MEFTEERKGEALILTQAVLWGFFPVITVLSFNSLPPLISLASSVIISTMVFVVPVYYKRRWHELLDWPAMRDVLWMTFFIGVLYYVFFFWGLKLTSPGNASIIGLTEVLFSFLFFHIWKREYISLEHIAGALLALAGAVIILFPNLTAIRGGDILILAAAAVAPFGNFFQRRARRRISTETIMFVRGIVSGIAILFLAWSLRQNFSTESLGDSLVFLIINGVFLFGVGKVLWIEGIHRISVTKANALSALSPLLTLLFAFLILGQPPTPWQLTAFVPMFFGIVLLGKNFDQRPEL